MEFLFLLGREPLLSFRELEEVFSDGHVRVVLKNVASLESTDAVVQKNFSRLGGTIKVAQVLASMPAKVFLQDPVDALTRKEFMDRTLPNEKSIAFAISYFNAPVNALPLSAKQLGITLKKQYRSRFGHVRYVESRDPITSSVTVRRNKLLRGLDLWVVFENEKVVLARTVTVQDYESFSENDYGRPRPDAKSGMLPPKLARMMVNLAGTPRAILDPFVGSGTVLQEAALLGIQTLYGSDIEEEAIERTKKNLDWLRTRDGAQFQLHLQQQSIELLDPNAFQDVTGVVAEIDLGPPLSRQPGKKDVERFEQEAAVLVRALLSFISRTKRVDRCVIALPFWPLPTGAVFVDLHLPAGFRLRTAKQTHPYYAGESNARGGMLYRRDDQRVGREILCLDRSR